MPLYHRPWAYNLIIATSKASIPVRLPAKLAFARLVLNDVFDLGARMVKLVAPRQYQKHGTCRNFVTKWMLQMRWLAPGSPGP